MSLEATAEFRIIVQNERSVMFAYQGLVRQVELEVDRLARSTIDVLSRWFADDQIRLRDEVELIGSYLYRALFQGELEKALLRALEDHEHAAQPLRLVLEFQEGARNLATWPWEYLFLPDDPNGRGAGTFLASDTKLTLSRHVPMEDPDPPWADEEELRILVVRAGPWDQKTVDAEKVVSKLTEIEGQAPDRISLTVLPRLCDTCNGEKRVDNVRCSTCKGRGTEHGPTLRQFNDAIKERPHIVHFIGHGRFKRRAGALALVSEDDPNATHWLEDADVLQCFRHWKPRLVFLQACEGAHADTADILSGVAQTLTYGGVSAVIAMRFQITNEVAESFAVKFYDSIRDKPLDEAVQHGRDEVQRFVTSAESMGRWSFGCPVIYMHNFATAPERRRLQLPQPYTNGETRKKVSASAENEPSPRATDGLGNMTASVSATFGWPPGHFSHGVAATPSNRQPTPQPETPAAPTSQATPVALSRNQMMELRQPPQTREDDPPPSSPKGGTLR